jgi:hypothetical protein
MTFRAKRFPPARGSTGNLELEPMSEAKSKRAEIEILIDKATKATDASESMRFTQAACNAANAMLALRSVESM